jgi:RNA polymerase Rpb2, domain 6/RNA polymerase Rpb1, domain 2/RNA polymerase Rpb1, domain 5/RNA polymerase Rpb2, domain 3
MGSWNQLVGGSLGELFARALLSLPSLPFMANGAGELRLLSFEFREGKLLATAGISFGEGSDQRTFPLALRVPCPEADGSVEAGGRRIAPQGLLRLSPGTHRFAAPEKDVGARGGTARNRLVDRCVWVPEIGPSVVAEPVTGGWRIWVPGMSATTLQRLSDDPTGLTERRLMACVSSSFVGVTGSFGWFLSSLASSETAPVNWHDVLDLDRRQVLLYGYHVLEAVWFGLRRVYQRWEAGAAPAPSMLAGNSVSVARGFDGRDQQQVIRAALMALTSAVQGALDRALRPGPQAIGGPARTRFVDANAVSSLARFQQTRVVGFLGEELGEDDERASRLWRDTHLSMIGRLCPLDTPESSSCGLVRVLVPGWQPGRDGRFHDDVRGPQPLGASASLMPFLLHNDAVRGVIGSKNLRQQLPAAASEHPIVGEEVATDSPRLEGLNCLAVLTCLSGWNIEDAIVCSASLAKRFSAVRRERLRFELPSDSTAGVLPVELVGRSVQAGDRLNRPIHGETSAIRVSQSGVIADASIEVTEDGRRWLAVDLDVVRPLQVGDKLTGRHGNKGIVGAIVPDEDMPFVHLPDGGAHADVVLNPLGLLRRASIGALLEIHWGLVARSTGGTIEAGALSLSDPASLRAALSAVGAPTGKVTVTHAATGLDDQLVAGVTYLVRLDHLAAVKLQARRHAPRNNRTGQPARTRPHRDGEKLGRAQRLGEMELWALQAWGAHELLHDSLRDRRDEQGVWAASLQVVLELLQAAGLPTGMDTDSGVTTFAAPAVANDLPVWVDSTDPWRGSSAAPINGWSRIDLGEELLHPWFAPLVRGVVSEMEGETQLAPGRTSDSQAIAMLRSIVEDPATGQNKGARATRCLQYVITSVPVLPPHWLMPTVGASGSVIQSDLTQRYRALRRAVAGPTKVQRSVHSAVRNLLGTPRSGRGIAGLLESKQGLLRHQLLGTSVNSSARGVITPNPGLPVDEIGVPARVWDELRLGTDPDEPTGPVLVVNRPPTLQRHGLVALRGRRIDDATSFQLHPALLGPLAGDFDGDEVTVHYPVTRVAREEAWALLHPLVAARGPTMGELTLYTGQDVALGSGLVEAPGLAEVIADGTAAVGSWYEKALRASTGRASVSFFDLRDDDSVALSDARLGGLDDDRLGRIRLNAGVFLSGASRYGLTSPVNATSGYLDGLDRGLLEAASSHAIQSLADKKLDVRTAGQLTKRLVEALYAVTVDSDDCGTTDGIHLPYEESADVQPGGRGTLRRSPLFCLRAAHGHVCSACYGPSPHSGQHPGIGLRVGLLAAQSIGERGTQLALKAIHTGTTQADVGFVVDVLSGRAVDYPDCEVDGFCEPSRHARPARGVDAVGALRWAYSFGQSHSRVAEVHLELAIAMLDAYLPTDLEQRGRALTLAALDQPPLAAASVRGDLNPILEAVWANGSAAFDLGHPKVRLFAGWREPAPVKR